MELYKWIKCTEENYWNDSDKYATIVQAFDEIWTHDSCPYGWNILCKNNAYLMNIEKL